MIYAIQGDYQYKVKQESSLSDVAQQDTAKQENTKPQGRGKGAGKPGNQQQTHANEKLCKAKVKELAKELQSQYGKPRGQGGLWVVFRQLSDSANKSVKLYGHRCRTGMYSIIYSDESVRWKALPVKADTPD